MSGGENADSHQEGTAHAAQYVATGTGAVGQLWIYLVTPSETSQLVVGLYTDNQGHPGTLLANATIDSPDNSNAWNHAPAIPVGDAQAVSVITGQLYWIAALSPEGNGVVDFGWNYETGYLWEHSESMVLSALPNTWVSPTPVTSSNTGVGTVVQFCASP